MERRFVGKTKVNIYYTRLDLVGTLAVRDYVDSTKGLLQRDCRPSLVCSSQSDALYSCQVLSDSRWTIEKLRLRKSREVCHCVALFFSFSFFQESLAEQTLCFTVTGVHFWQKISSEGATRSSLALLLIKVLIQRVCLPSWGLHSYRSHRRLINIPDIFVLNSMNIWNMF